MKHKLPLMYLSGTYPLTKAASEADLIKRSGCTHRCYSYVYVATQKEGGFRYSKRMAEGLQWNLKNKIGIMMDSSAYSIQKLFLSGAMTKADVDRTVDQYVEFVQTQGKKWDFYVNLDYEKDSPQIYKIQKKLESKGIRPLPVFHGDSGFAYLERYIKEGYDFICLGSVKRKWSQQLQYYGRCFEIAAKGKNVKLHGLAVTGYHLAFAFPWYSLDSATWAKNGAYGMIVVPHPVSNQLTGIHVSNKHAESQKNSINHMEPSIKKLVIRHIEDMGFDYKIIKSSGYERSVFNAKVFARIHDLKPEKETISRWGALV